MKKLHVMDWKLFILFHRNEPHHIEVLTAKPGYPLSPVIPGLPGTPRSPFSPGSPLGPLAPTRGSGAVAHFPI